MRNCIVLVIVIFLWGCQDVKHPEIPENLIGKEKMVEILTDAYLANAARSIDQKAILAHGLKMDSLIYKKHQIDSLQFADSNEYYSANLKDYFEMFQKVEINLEVFRKELDSIKVANRKSDSINKIPSIDVEVDEPAKDSLI